MGLFKKMAFWKKEELPKFPEDDSMLPPEQAFPPSYPEPRRYEAPQFQQPSFNDESMSRNEFQVISAKLDVLNSKIELLTEKVNNLERNLNEARIKW